ncbi:uncharacterized protein LOC134369745 [Cynocephalus volans]|uniref:uncharacterized protein LOC134369745 n=1 Tax=Cynocephalus volans TaxID=110931 RepID=UPI002FC59F05
MSPLITLQGGNLPQTCLPSCHRTRVTPLWSTGWSLLRGVRLVRMPDGMAPCSSELLAPVTLGLRVEQRGHGPPAQPAPPPYPSNAGTRLFRLGARTPESRAAVPPAAAVSLSRFLESGGGGHGGDWRRNADGGMAATLLVLLALVLPSVCGDSSAYSGGLMLWTRRRSCCGWCRWSAVLSWSSSVSLKSVLQCPQEMSERVPGSPCICLSESVRKAPPW